MLLSIWAQPLEILLESIIWFDYSNQWAIQWMNQVANQFANQPNERIWMQSFQITFHQRKLKWRTVSKGRMQSFQARSLIQQILNFVGFAMIKNQSKCHSANRKRMQCFFITFCQSTLNQPMIKWMIQTITKKNLCRSTDVQTWVFNQNLSSQVKRQTVINN